MSIAGGVLLWLGTHQIYPSQWVASMLGFAENAVYMSLSITLMILGISGLLGMMFGPSLYGWGSGFLRTNRKHLTTIEHKQPEESESIGADEGPWRIPLSEAAARVYEVTKDKFTATIAESDGRIECTYAHAFFLTGIRREHSG